MSDAQNNILGTKKTVSFPTSSPPAPNAGATPFVMPRQTGTGVTRGTQNISGLEVVTDPDSRTPMIMFGSSKGAFDGKDFGLKISRIDPKTGNPFDVTTATNEQLAFLAPSDTQLLYNQHVANLLFGLQAGGFAGQDYGLKVSKINPTTGAPYDVTTATDAQLAFSSAFDNLRVIKTDTVSFTVPNGFSSFEYAANHGFKFAPICVAACSLGVGSNMMPFTLIEETGGSAGLTRLHIAPGTDQRQVFFNVTRPAYGTNTVGALAISVKYYLLQETAN